MLIITVKIIASLYEAPTLCWALAALRLISPCY